MTVKLGIVSDLHLDSSMINLRNLQCDMLAVLGDLAVDLDLLQMWLDRYAPDMPILFVPGNHEYEGRRYDTVLSALKEALAPFENVKLLQNEAIDIGTHKVLATTLWTDFSSDADLAASKKWAKQMVHEFSNTYVVQNGQKRRVEPFDYVQRYQEALEFITQECAVSTKPVCVLSHFAPSVDSVPPRYANDFSGFWASNTSIPDNVVVWAHGHIHDSTDHMKGNTRVVANPRGSSSYPDLAQNNAFNPNFYIEL